jgi:predicted nuclease of predicted toxin-antitoxin system
VRLLFDENLSRRLPQLLADLFPDSADVLTAGLSGATDQTIWEHARAEGLVLVTKDEDFQRFSIIRGPPPKVVWLRLGNSTTADVARLLRFRAEQIRAFVADEESAFLSLG